MYAVTRFGGDTWARIMHHPEVELGRFLPLAGGETNPPGGFAEIFRATITALKLCISDS